MKGYRIEGNPIVIQQSDNATWICRDRSITIIGGRLADASAAVSAGVMLALDPTSSDATTVLNFDCPATADVDFWWGSKQTFSKLFVRRMACGQLYLHLD